jgi:hypothetical protein
MSRQNVNEDREREMVEARVELLRLAEAQAKTEAKVDSARGRGREASRAPVAVNFLKSYK